MSAPSSSSLKRRAVLAVLGLGLPALGYAAVLYRFPSAAPEAAALSVDAAHSAAIDGQIFLIDIRRPDEWDRTGIGAGALPLDMRRADFADQLAQITGGDLNAPVALICARGVRSARLTRTLADAGFTNLIDVPEGMLGSGAGEGWLAKGLPVTRP